MRRVPPLPPLAVMRWSIVRRIVTRLAPATILEIGCGQGTFGARLASCATYLGLEPDPISFAVAKPRIEAAGGQVRNSAAEDLPPATRYDLVCAFEVIEHIESDAAAIARWSEFVLPGGHLLLSTPAWPHRYNSWDVMAGHYRRYTPEHLRDVISAAGLEDVRVWVYGWPLGNASELIRTRVAARRGASDDEVLNASMQIRTARSARNLQPKAAMWFGVQLATAPFSFLQRLQPRRGVGLIAVARCGGQTGGSSADT